MLGRVDQKFRFGHVEFRMLLSRPLVCKELHLENKLTYSGDWQHKHFT